MNSQKVSNHGHIHTLQTIADSSFILVRSVCRCRQEANTEDLNKKRIKKTVKLGPCFLQENPESCCSRLVMTTFQRCKLQSYSIVFGHLTTSSFWISFFFNPFSGKKVFLFIQSKAKDRECNIVHCRIVFHHLTGTWNNNPHEHGLLFERFSSVWTPNTTVEGTHSHNADN